MRPGQPNRSAGSETVRRPCGSASSTASPGTNPPPFRVGCESPNAVLRGVNGRSAPPTASPGTKARPLGVACESPIAVLHGVNAGMPARFAPAGARTGQGAGISSGGRRQAATPTELARGEPARRRRRGDVVACEATGRAAEARSRQDPDRATRDRTPAGAGDLARPRSRHRDRAPPWPATGGRRGAPQRSAARGAPDSIRAHRGHTVGSTASPRVECGATPLRRLTHPRPPAGTNPAYSRRFGLTPDECRTRVSISRSSRPPIRRPATCRRQVGGRMGEASTPRGSDRSPSRSPASGTRPTPRAWPTRSAPARGRRAPRR